MQCCISYDELNFNLIFVLQFTLQLALACLCEYTFHLTRLNSDMMYIHQDSGLMNISYFKFDVNDSKGKIINN